MMVEIDVRRAMRPTLQRRGLAQCRPSSLPSSRGWESATTRPCLKLKKKVEPNDFQNHENAQGGDRKPAEEEVLCKVQRVHLRKVQ